FSSYSIEYPLQKSLLFMYSSGIVLNIFLRSSSMIPIAVYSCCVIELLSVVLRNVTCPSPQIFRISFGFSSSYFFSSFLKSYVICVSSVIC
ncbi:hypothetical protein OAC06_07290, partial [Alphaproteobacteria bacterium]|nr:hypothetical protein [Alphaproteobacteria bacterium]